MRAWISPFTSFWMPGGTGRTTRGGWFTVMAAIGRGAIGENSVGKDWAGKGWAGKDWVGKDWVGKVWFGRD
jgi:hypothetical protein